MAMIEIQPATMEDAPAILALQRLAYQTEAAIYDDYSLPPLVEELDSLRAQFGFKRILKAVAAGRLVGSVRALQRDDTCHIERLFVHPDHRRQGIGVALMAAIEAAHPQAARFELFTGHRSADNLRLYERLGYRRFRQERAGDKVTLVFLEKPGKGRTA